MSTNKDKAVIFLIVLIVLALGLGGGTYYLLQQEKTKNVDLTQQLEEARTQQQATKAELNDAKNRIASLQSNLAEAQTKISDLTSELETAESSKNNSLQELDKLRSELNNELNLKSGIQKDLDNSSLALKDSQSRLKDLEDKVNDLESKKKALEEKVKGLEEKAQNADLGVIVVSPDGGPAAPAAAVPVGKLEGKVAVVNKEYNFAVINLGDKDGVAVGNIFSVTHNNKVVGDLKVEKVHENMSAAGFVSPDLKDKIAEGDKAELKR